MKALYFFSTRVLRRIGPTMATLPVRTLTIESRPIGFNAFLIAVFAFFASFFINLGAAQAGVPLIACAAIDPAQGGTPMVANNFFLSTIVGDRITVTLTTGTQINAAPPGSGFSPVANPFVQDIDGSNAGNWNFTIDPGGGLASFSCAVGGAIVPPIPPQLSKSFTDDPVQSGSTVTLEFTITNADTNNAATNLSFSDNLGAVIPGLVATGLPTSNVCGAGSQVTGTSLLTLTGGSLAASGSCTFAVTLQVPANTVRGSYLNTTSVITGIILNTNVTGTAAMDTLRILDTVDETQEFVMNFLNRRARLITIEDPLLTPHLNGSGQQSGGPVNVTALNGAGGTRVTFSTSLSQMAHAGEGDAAGKLEHPGAMALGYPKGARSGPEMEHPFNLWVRGMFTSYEFSVPGSNPDGTFGFLYVGGEYKMQPSLLVGMIAQFDWINEEEDRTNIGAEGEGWMVGPYIVGQLAPNIYYQARAAWGQSDNDVTPFGTYTDDFDTERWLVSGKIEGRYQRGPWRMSPIAGIIYFEDEQERYIDSLGNIIGSQTASLGQVTFGPQIAHGRQWRDDLYVEVFGEVTGIWEFDHDDWVIGGRAAGRDDVRAKLTGGIILGGRNGIRFQASGFVDGVGADDYDAYGGKVRLRIPLN